MSVFDDAQRRLQLAQIRQRAEQLTPRERTLMGQLARQSGQTFESLGLLLDTPGAIVRGIATGDPLSGFSFDRDVRKTGKDVLRAAGLLPESGSGVAGFAAEVLMDPLTYVSGPLTALTKGGRAVRGAGLLEEAPKVASKLFSEPTLTRKFTERALKRANVPLDSAAALSGRPVYGPRWSQVRLSVDDVVRNSSNPQAKQSVERWLKANYPNLTYADIAHQKLGGTFGLGAPLQASSAAFTPFGQAGAEKIADVLDVAGQAMAWGPVGRGLGALFDKRVDGAYDTGSQLAMMRKNELVGQREMLGRAMTTPMIQKLNAIKIPTSVSQTTGVQTLMSIEGNRALTRIIENVPTANDTQLLNNAPGLRQWVDEWRTIAQQLQDESRKLGMSVHDLKDPNGLEYLPRFGDEFSPDSMDRVVPRGATYGTKTSDMMARVDSLKLRGGLDTIRQISLDSTVRKYAQSRASKAITTETDASIGQHIGNLVQRLTGEVIPPEKQIRIARIMQDINTDLASGVSIFSAHPASNIARYIDTRQKKMAVADAAIESLTDAVVDAEYSTIPGGQHYTLAEAVQRMANSAGLAVGPKGVSAELESQVRRRLAARLGKRPEDISFALTSVPAATVQRLTKMSDFYSNPEAQSAVRELLDKTTSVFKSFVLAWPARYTRDLYSGAFQNWLENGSVTGTLEGMGAASQLLAGKYADAAKTLSKIPKYQGMTPQQVVEEFIKDVGTNGALKGLSTLDLGSSNIVGDSFRHLVPGMFPDTMIGSLSELAPKAGRSWRQFSRDFATIRGVSTSYDTMNPVLRWGDRMNELTDSINRLGGFIALMTQGIDPAYAAKRVLASQVDYASLTPFELRTMKFIFPWWSYSSRMGKYVVNHLMERPGGRFGQTVRAVNDAQATDDNQYIPESLRQRFAIRDPFSALYPPSGDATRYIVDIDIPGVDILNTLRLSPQSGFSNFLSDTFSKTLGELANQSNPNIRALAELATGQDLFSKRPLAESYTNADRIYQAVTGRRDKLTPLAKVTINNLPGIQRLLGVGGTLADQRITPLERGIKLSINTTMGIKQALAEKEFELMELRSKIGGKTEPYARSFEVQYIPDELQPLVPPEIQELMVLDAKVQKDLRRRWQDDKQGVPVTRTGVLNNPLREVRFP